ITSSMPESTASSTRYCTTGLSTIGISSLGRFLVAGRKRVPKPATAITAFLIFNVISSNVIFSNAVSPGRRLPSVLKIVPDVPTRLGSRSASRTCARNCPPLPRLGGEGRKRDRNHREAHGGLVALTPVLPVAILQKAFRPGVG